VGEPEPALNAPLFFNLTAGQIGFRLSGLTAVRSCRRSRTGCQLPIVGAPCPVYLLRGRWFSQTSTGEKNLASAMSPFGHGRRGAWTAASPTRDLHRWGALTNVY
jgi:hypothetical protein